jgi:hypothetical protein
MTRYFDMMDNMRLPGRWVLDGPFDEQGEEIDSWQFGEGRRVELARTPCFSMSHQGRALDISQTGLGVPVVHGRVAAILEQLCGKDVQLLPARLEGQVAPWFILNVLRIIRCIDEARCEYVERWKPEDNRPDKVGEYRNVRGLKVDPSKVGYDAHIFRPWGWRVAILVSEPLKQALEQEGITGVKYIEA